MGEGEGIPSGLGKPEFQSMRGRTQLYQSLAGLVQTEAGADDVEYCTFCLH